MFAFWEDIKERPGIDKVYNIYNREAADHGLFKMI